MKGAALKNAPEVSFCGSLLVWMDERKKRFSNEKVCLGVEMIGENRVKVDELEVSGEKSPVWEG